MKRGEHCWIEDGTAISPCDKGCGVRQGDDPGQFSECAKAGAWVPCDPVQTPNGTYEIAHYDGSREPTSPPVPGYAFWCYREECLRKWENRPLEERLRESEP
jgi:hypothetical protein